MDQISNPNLARIVDKSPAHGRRRFSAWVAAAVFALALGYLGFWYRKGDEPAAPPAGAPLVTVSRPLQRDLEARLGF